jgi:hypothetical protein
MSHSLPTDHVVRALEALERFERFERFEPPRSRPPR